MRNVAIRGCDSSRHRPWVAPFEIFRNRRIELFEVKGRGELNTFGRNALIGHGISTQPIDNAFFISILFAVRLRAGETGYR